MEPSVDNVGLRFGFAATAPARMATPVFGAVPLSLVLAFAMIVFSVAITGAYVLIANQRAR